MKKTLVCGAALAAILCGGQLTVGMPSRKGDKIQSAQAVSPPPYLLKPSFEADFGTIPLQFVPNNGQLDERVAYYINGKDKSVYFTSDGLTFVLLRRPREQGELHGAEASNTYSASHDRWVVKLDFIDATKGVRPVGLEDSGTVVSYFHGGPEDWTTGLHAQTKIIYEALWPGIDLVYSGTFSKLKYEFIVHPGADPSLIKLAYRGVDRVDVDSDGRLRVQTPPESFNDDIPLAYQETGLERKEIKIAYHVQHIKPCGMETISYCNGDTSEAATFIYGFQLGKYDRNRALVIDPAVLVYCGYVGGDGDDYINDIAVDESGNAYIVGSTDSTQTTFPVAVGPDLTYGGAMYDAFVAKINPSGTALVYCGYIGGGGIDTGRGIAVDSMGQAYVTGTTSSTQASFPEIVGPDLTSNGGTDGFVAKVNAAGTALVYCGFIGGAGTDNPLKIGLDPSGNAYVAGTTGSTQATFPVMVGPDLTHNGNSDAFVAKINASGTAFDYCGYIGGAGRDEGFSIAVDASGHAYVTGETDSSPATFPVLVGPELTCASIYFDAFVAKVNAEGSALDYCGYIGGGDIDGGLDVAVDPSGSAYVTGYTASWQDFPRVIGPDLTYNSFEFSQDAFVAKVTPTGEGFAYCGFIGGMGFDVGNSIAVDESGNAFVVGTTNSLESSFPVREGPDLTSNGGADAFVAKVNAYGTALVYSGYIGGSSSDTGLAVAVDSEGHAYVTGQRAFNSAGFPVNVGPDLTYNGGSDDAYIAKVHFAKPVVAIIFPTDGTAVSGIVPIQIDAYDQRGISDVDIYIDELLVASDATYPYGHTWDTTGLAGPHTIRGIATILPNLVAEAQVSVNVVDELPPLIVVSPLSQSVVSGHSTLLNVEATGTEPLAFQWYEGSSGDMSNPIIGAINVSYLTPSLMSPVSYWVRVSNGFGQAVSNTAVISIGLLSSLEGGVYNNATAVPIEGAAVILGDYPQVLTDAGGRYQITDVEAGDYLLTISKTGYNTYRDTVGISISSSSIRNFRLSPIGGTGVSIDSLTSKYNGFVYYLDGVDFVVTYTAHIDWGGHAPGHVRFITSNAQYEVVATGDSASRDFNVGQEFAPCSTLRAVAISSDGSQSPIVSADFTVMPMPLAGIFFEKTDRGDSYFYQLRKSELEFINETLDNDLIPRDIPIFGAKGFNLNTLLSVNGSANSSGQVEFGLDLAENPIVKDKWSLGELAGISFKITPELRVVGQYSYHDCRYVWDGSYLTLHGNLAVERSWPFLSPILGAAYAKAALRLGMDATLGIEDLDPIRLNGLLDIRPTLRGSLGAGIDRFLCGELWIQGAAAFNLQYPAAPHLYDASVNITAGASAFVLGREVWTEEMLSWDWSLTGSQARPSLMGEPAGILSKPIEREYLKDPVAGAFYRNSIRQDLWAESDSGLPKISAELLQDSVYPFSDASFGSGGGVLGLAWLQDAPERLAVNRTAVVSSFYDNTAWNVPVMLGDDGTADFHPQILLFADGDAVAIWEDEKVIHADTATMEDLVANLEVSAATYSAALGTWQPFQRLSDNAFLDGSPQIAGTDQSNVLVTWISNEANDLRGSPLAPNKIWSSRFDGTTWSTAQLVAEVPYCILKYTLAYDGTTGHLVMSLDADGDPATMADTVLYRITSTAGAWGAPVRLGTDDLPDVNPKLAFDQAGHIVLVWLRGNELSCSIDFGTPAVIYRDEFSTNLADFKLASSSGGRLAVVWAKPAEFSSDLEVLFFDPAHQAWASAPHQMTFDPEIERNIAVAFYGANSLVAAYNRTPVETTTSTRTTADGETIVLAIPQPGITDLYVLEYVMGRDLALSPLSLRADPPNPEPGAGVRLTVTAANTGDETAPAVPVAFYRGDPSSGGTLIGEALAPAGLRPGDRVDLSVLWTVPETDAPLRIFAVIDPASDYDTDFRMNNGIDIEIVKADLTINGVNWEWRGADRVLITARVLNAGVIPSQATTLKFRQDSGAGTLISDQVLPAMAKGEYRDVTIEWDVSVLALPEYPVHIAVDEENLVPEFDEADNWKLATVTPVTVLDSIVVLSPNGGEVWPAGSVQSIRWAISGIIGNVGIDISIDGGMTWSPIVASTANSGNYPWTVTAAASSQCLIRVFEEADGVPFDPSDGLFGILPAPSMKKVDFNGDGQEDILWRYYGAGGFQGLNVAWLMNQASMPAPAPATADMEAPQGRSLLSGAPAGVIYRADRGSGIHPAAVPPAVMKTVVSGDRVPALEAKRIMRDPLGHERKRSRTGEERSGGNAKEDRLIRKDAVSAAALDDGTAKIAALQLATEIVFSQIPDTGWEIAGTGDFNGDAKTDILWRYYGVGDYQGLNDIWFMDGTTFIGESVFSQIQDTNWRIVGTGDFNSDGQTDILWRYYGAGDYQGLNVIWYMNGAQMAGEAVFSQVLDTDWRIEGTGDFNGDGQTDILWRYYGAGDYQGLNDIWFMNSSTFISESVFSQIMDTAWQIGGTGDFNNDGHIDILWRYYGTAAYQGLNDIWYMNGTAFVSEEVFSQIRT